jgi:hypothetical protein
MEDIVCAWQHSVSVLLLWLAGILILISKLDAVFSACEGWSVINHLGGVQTTFSKLKSGVRYGVS